MIFTLLASLMGVGNKDPAEEWAASKTQEKGVGIPLLHWLFEAWRMEKTRPKEAPSALELKRGKEILKEMCCPDNRMNNRETSIVPLCKWKVWKVYACSLNFASLGGLNEHSLNLHF